MVSWIFDFKSNIKNDRLDVFTGGKMEFAQRLDKVPPYLFVEISRKIAEKKSKGFDVFSLEELKKTSKSTW